MEVHVPMRTWGPLVHDGSWIVQLLCSSPCTFRTCAPEPPKHLPGQPLSPQSLCTLLLLKGNALATLSIQKHMGADSWPHSACPTADAACN